MFCARYCGIYDSYSWVTYLPKIFWIFTGMFPTRFVGNNLWEIPPTKGYGNMFQNIFTIKNCLWIFPIHIIVSYPSKNNAVTPGVCPRPIPQDIGLANLSLKTPVVVFATKNNTSSNLTKISRPKAKIFWGISPKTPHSF